MSVFLVDGYNLMHRFGFGRDSERSLEEKRARLEAELRRFLAASPAGTRVIIIYDGVRGLPHQTEHRGGLEIRFSRPPQNADALLEARIKTPERGQEDEKPGPISATEARKWAKTFGFERGQEEAP